MFKYSAVFFIFLIFVYILSCLFMFSVVVFIFSCLFIFIADCLHIQLFVYTFNFCVHFELSVYIFSCLFIFLIFSAVLFTCSAFCLHFAICLHFTYFDIFATVCPTSREKNMCNAVKHGKKGETESFFAPFPPN